MRSATEGSGDNKGLSEKMDSEEKEQILDVAGQREAFFQPSVVAFGGVKAKCFAGTICWTHWKRGGWVHIQITAATYWIFLRFTRVDEKYPAISHTYPSLETWKFHHTKALKDGQSWLDSNPEADAEEIKEKHKEIEGICVSWNKTGIARYCQVSWYKVKGSRRSGVKDFDTTRYIPSDSMISDQIYPILSI